MIGPHTCFIMRYVLIVYQEEILTVSWYSVDMYDGLEVKERNSFDYWV